MGRDRQAFVRQYLVQLRMPIIAPRFDVWQNVASEYGLVAWTVSIVIMQRRTPLELSMSPLDQQLIALAQKLQPQIKNTLPQTIRG
ncbi:MAG: hypothetical protein ETSY2_26385 [Candidatus Entotheonella gemina]|uniref:Uncharacterized protein n=1 Tax=Candidatus Entotheonella gemina TaxID=1429439 RepID=W4M4K5_9BACT|nr:MAG: hypothetical protein ETSY2_26385 [Candidatus Entotheonella gemina]